MITYIPANSPLAELDIFKREGYEPVLYTLDELKSDIDESLNRTKIAKVILYSEKMSPMFFGYVQRTKNGKPKVVSEQEFLNMPRNVI